MRFVWILLTVLLVVPHNTAAQNRVGEFVKGVAKDVALDPTTYIPFGASWLSKQLDWNSSQVFFENGYVESNPEFTVSGLPYDKPISHAAGNRKLFLISLPVLQFSIINNAGISAAERLLIMRHPNHRKLIKAIGWVEKIVVNGYVGYNYSHNNFRQWRINNDLARQKGFR